MTYPEYGEGYFERAEGSNYRNYADDEGWPTLVLTVDISDILMSDKPKVLEVGCAKGWFVHHALRRGWDAYGFDISAYAVGQAPVDVRDRLAVHNAAVTPWPYDPDTYDAVVSWELLEHIREEDVDTVLSEMRWVLRAASVTIHKVNFGGDEHDHDTSHFTLRPRDWWVEKFMEHGMFQNRETDQLEAQLDRAFKDRDWAGRFLVFET